jgi:hypothetical protein
MLNDLLIDVELRMWNVVTFLLGMLNIFGMPEKMMSKKMLEKIHLIVFTERL